MDKKQGILKVILFLLMTTSKPSLGANCFEKVADIVFVLDSSSSIRQEDFDRQLNFVQSVVDNFKIGTNNIQVGIVTFNNVVHLMFHLNRHQNKGSVKAAISQVPFQGGGTNIGGGIKFARSKMYLSENGGRPWAAKIMIVLTDGFSTSTTKFQNAQMEASFAKHNEVTIMLIGVGNAVKYDDMEYIASEPTSKYVYKVDDYQALSTIRESLATIACEDVEREQKDDPQAVGLENEKEPRSFCGGKPADIYFLLDASSSVYYLDFERQLHFVNDVIDIFDISNNHTRVGVVSYSNGIHPVIPLNNGLGKTALKQRVRTLAHLTGNTNTADAIRYLRETAFQPDVAREEVAHIVIVVTDGQSMKPKLTAMEAKLAQKQHINLFAIGVGGSINDKELMDIASDPDSHYVFKVDNYASLRSIKDVLAIKTCKEMVSQKTSTRPRIDCNRNGPMDVMFVFDGYNLGVEKSNYIRRGIVEIVHEMKIGDNSNNRVGILSEVAPHDGDLALSAVTDEIDFEKKVKRMQNGKLKKLLTKLRLHSFREHNGGRSDSQHIAIIFLEENFHNTNNIILEAKRTRLRIKLFIVAIGDETVTSIERLASEPSLQYLIRVPRYEEVSGSAIHIVQQLC